jgi:hypothetical protein
MNNFYQLWQESSRWKRELSQQPFSSKLLIKKTLMDKLAKYLTSEYFIHFGKSYEGGCQFLAMNVSNSILDRNTPRGIYAFPGSSKNVLGWKHFSKARGCVYVIQPKNPDKILNIRQESQSDPAYKFYVELKLKCFDKIKDDAYPLVNPDLQYKLKNAGISLNDNGQVGVAITKSLLEAGIEGVVDWGTGAVCVLEPTQAVFLGTKFIKIIDSFKNPERDDSGRKGWGGLV